MAKASPYLQAVLAVAFLAPLAGCKGEDPFPSDAELDVLQSLHSPGKRPPPDPTNRWGDDPRAAGLGQALFSDQKLSRCGNVSCATCHSGESFAASERFVPGCDGSVTDRHPSSLLNAGYSQWLMWDGRADTLWAQAILAYVRPNQLAGSPEFLRARLLEEPEYLAAYTELAGKGPQETPDDQLLANFGKIIAAYERTLNRTEAPWDEIIKRFIAAVNAGTEESDPAFLGLKTYVRKGECAVCHTGPTLSDGRFFNIGLADLTRGARGAADGLPFLFEWTYNSAGPYSDDPLGPAAVRLHALKVELETTPEAFLGAFRTPTLRNIELSAPYMHTGRFGNLEEVIEFYNVGGDEVGRFPGKATETIIPREFTAEESAALKDLLISMTGKE